MRILVITNLYPPFSIGGYEQACRDIVEGLRQRGHGVDVLASTYGLRRPAFIEGAHRLLPIDPIWKRDQPGSAGTLSLWKRNVSSDRIFKSLLQVAKPDVLYVWSMRGMASSLLTQATNSGLPMVFNIQDDWLFRQIAHDRWIASWYYRSRSPLRRVIRASLQSALNPLLHTCFPQLQNQSAQYISQAFATIYHEKGWQFSKERIIYNGIDLQHFSSARPVARRMPRKLLFIGRLNEEKGAHVAIEALALVTKRRGREAVTLTIAGTSHDVEYQARLHRLVHKHALEDIVTFQGSVPRNETANLYKEHDILLFPSSWIEGFSLVLLEALASGLPVIGTTTGGSAEILEDEETGLTVPPEDACMLARQVERLLDDPIFAHRLGERGSARVCQRFNQHQIVIQVEEFLQDVIDSRRPL